MPGSCQPNEPVGSKLRGFLAKQPKPWGTLEKAVDCLSLGCIICGRRVGAGPKVSRLKELSDLEHRYPPVPARPPNRAPRDRYLRAGTRF